MTLSEEIVLTISDTIRYLCHDVMMPASYFHKFSKSQLWQKWAAQNHCISSGLLCSAQCHGQQVLQFLISDWVMMVFDYRWFPLVSTVLERTGFCWFLQASAGFHLRSTSQLWRKYGFMVYFSKIFHWYYANIKAEQHLCSPRLAESCSCYHNADNGNKESVTLSWVLQHNEWSHSYKHRQV